MADGEGVIAKHSNALAVSILDSSDNNIQSGQLAFHLQPRFAAPSWRVNRLWVFNHQPFVAACLSGDKQFVKFISSRGLRHERADHVRGDWQFIRLKHQLSLTLATVARQRTSWCGQDLLQ